MHPATTPAQDAPSPRGRWIAPLVVLACGLGMAFYPALLSGFDRLQIQGGDPSLVHYIQEHSWRWIAGLPMAESFWDPPCYTPHKNISAHSDVMLGTAPLYWLWRACGAAPGLAFQLWMMASLALNFLAGHLLLRRHLGTSPWASAVGSALLAFGSSRLANFNSPQLLAIFPALFALLLLGNALAASRVQRNGQAFLWLTGFLAAAVIQAWSAFYPAAFLALILMALAAASLVIAQARRPLIQLLRSQGIRLLFPLALGLLALYPLASHYLQAASETRMRPWSNVLRGLPTWASYVYPGEDHWLYGGLSSWKVFQFGSPPSSHSGGVGFLTGLVALVALIRHRRRPLIQVTALTTAILVLVSLRIGEDFSLWKAAYHGLPGAGPLRYLARMTNYLALPAGMGVALALDSPRLRRPALAVVLGLACIAEQGHRLKSREQAVYLQYVERVAEAVPADAPAFFFSCYGKGLQNTESRRILSVIAMWAAWEAGIPTANGFYGLNPQGWKLAKTNPSTPKDRRALVKSLQSSAPEGTVHIEFPAEDFSLQGLKR